MANRKTPETSTYQTERVSLIGSPQQRNGLATKDQRFLNLMPEIIKTEGTDGKKYYLLQRPGLTASLPATATAGASRGVYYWKGSVFRAVGGTLYRDNTSLITLTGTTGAVGFCEYNGTTDSLIVLDGTKGWVISTSFVATQITSANFPTPHVPFPMYMNGYLFVTKAGTADVYNSKLEDPLTWTAGEFYTAELYPDAVVAMVKMNNYLAAIGTSTIEYLYDAATPTGSPLGRNDTAVQQFGTPAPYSVAQAEGEVLMIGNTGTGGHSVWILKGFKASEIGTEAVKRSLEEEGTNISSAKGYLIRTAGHKLYVLNLTNRTWVFDIEEKLWHEWSSTNNASAFLCNHACSGPAGEPYLLHPTDGRVLVFDPDVTSDVGVPAPAEITTVKIDFGNNGRKFGHRVSLVADVPNTSGSTPVSVQWSDDDYKTWSTARDLDLAAEDPCLRQLGMFRRRAFRFTYTGAYPIRIEALEMDYNGGRP